MPIWKHVVLNLLALASLLLMPYVLIAAGLALVYAGSFLRRRWKSGPAGQSGGPGLQPVRPLSRVAHGSPRAA